MRIHNSDSLRQGLTASVVVRNYHVYPDGTGILRFFNSGNSGVNGNNQIYLPFQGLNGLDVKTVTGANAAIAKVKKAINTVSTERATLGAIQNRLEYTVNNLDTTAENMTAANSRIRDTDMAKEMMNYTKMNVLTQAAQAMLAQANQQPQAVLQLLQ